MSWELADKEEVAEYCRTTQQFLRDEWYDSALGMVEDHTGWYSLTTPIDVDEYVSGNGSAILVPKTPINSVTSVYVQGTLLPAVYYYVAWNGIEIVTYRPGEVYDVTVQLGYRLNWGEVFPDGLRNIRLVYNVGGMTSLPTEYQYKFKLAMLMIIKELSTVPRNEGSDTMLNKYRPDRTMLPEEVLTSYGMHGKINGILNSVLPKQRLYA